MDLSHLGLFHSGFSLHFILYAILLHIIFSEFYPVKCPNPLRMHLSGRKLWYLVTSLPPWMRLSESHFKCFDFTLSRMPMLNIRKGSQCISK